ncbi:MAG: CheR family methyltransferase, partial [Lacisediminimonas sp.]|nr:CheR family methyltransferase [Lacisediminimonas sp.]
MDNHASLVVAPSHDRSLVRSTLGFPVVGLGASAGGLSALIKFFENTPVNSGMAFVVVLHLSPTHESNVDAILQRVTGMPVRQVMESVPIEANHVYVIAPDRQLTMTDNILKVNAQERPPGRHVVVDLFFRSLAEAHRERAMAVVLSGAGGDGSGGVPWIKEQGGIIIAQDPEDAEHDEMPRAAIDTGTVDFVLPVTEIPRKLQEIWHNAQVLVLPADASPEMPHAAPAANQFNSEEALQQVVGLLRERTGHDFRHYKRATMLRRIERRMQVRAVQTLVAYRDVLQKDPTESAALLKDMLIGVTNFFRDRDAFEALEREVLPVLFRNKNAGDTLRAWVPACSTGEEAYSIAMLFAEHCAAMPAPPQVNIFASDIDDRAIAVGRAGIYPSSILTDVAPGRLRQFFNKEQDRYRIRKGIRDRVLFAAHNILRDPPFSKVDLISCRNLLIYLNRDVQSHVLEMFHFALNPGGYLFLGSSESADGISSFFEPVNKKARIYRAKPASR